MVISLDPDIVYTVLRRKLQTMHQISFLTSYGRSTIGKYILEKNQEHT